MKSNKLKFTDLMIGDWVLFEGTPAKILGVEIYGNTLYVQINLTDLWHVSGFEPIPLTPEILEKNGLDNDPYGCHFKEDEYMALEISVEEEGIYWTINYNEYGILKLKYVHQLQHALKLCGIDKEIVV